jgi:hypothetical protein
LEQEREAMREHCARNKESSGAAPAANNGASPRAWRAGLISALWLVAFVPAPPVSAATLSYTGSLTQDDQVVSFRFYVTASSDATFRTLSYAGGTDANGSAIAPGGFDPVLSLFDAAGDLVVFMDDGSEPDINADPVTGLALDSFFTWSLVPGEYTLKLSQSNNYPDIGIFAPFSRQGEGNFTTTYGCGAGNFFDFGCDRRSGDFIAEVFNVTATDEPPVSCGGIEEPPCDAPVPLPTGMLLFSTGLTLLAWTCRYKNRRSRAVAPGSAVAICVFSIFVGFHQGANASELLDPASIFPPNNCIDNMSVARSVASDEEAMALPNWRGSCRVELLTEVFACEGDASLVNPLLRTYQASIDAVRAVLEATSAIWHPPEIRELPLTCTESPVTVYARRTTDPASARRYYVPVSCIQGYEGLIRAHTTASYCKEKPCDVQPLMPITDPLAQEFEDKGGNVFDRETLSDAMKDALDCIEREVPIEGGVTSRDAGSTHRPPSYNAHLIEVWNKWQESQKDKNRLNPACDTVRADIEAEFRKHSLKKSQRPVSTSRHTDLPSRAFDLSVNFPGSDWNQTCSNQCGANAECLRYCIQINPRIDLIAAGCGVTRFSPVGDPVHFDKR